MKPTTVSLMRRLSTIIHPQLPLDSRQTAQLLASLTSSFQRHLDQAHPVASSSRSGKSVARGSFPARAARGRSASQSSFLETTTHFDAIITHPAFGGLQPPSSITATSQEQKAFAALRIAEDKLKYGALNVFEAADLFRVIYLGAINAPPRAEFSFAARFCALLKSDGQDSVCQFFNTTGFASRWVNLMFHEHREHEVFQVMRDTNTISRLLPYYLAATLQTHGIRQLLTEMQRVHDLVQAEHVSLTTEACAKTMLKISHLILKQPQLATDITASDLTTALHKFIFHAQAPMQTNLFIALSQLSPASAAPPTLPISRATNNISTLPVAATASPLLAFIKTLHHNDTLGNYWRATRSRRSLLLESTLRAAGLLCAQQRYRHAQYLLRFCETTFGDELGCNSAPAAAPASAAGVDAVDAAVSAGASDRRRLTVSSAGRQRSKRRSSTVQESVAEEQSLLSRLDGLLQT